MPKKKAQDFSVFHPHAAGIDVGATFHVVAVSPECDPNPVRRFESFTTEVRAPLNKAACAILFPLHDKDLASAA